MVLQTQFEAFVPVSSQTFRTVLAVSTSLSWRNKFLLIVLKKRKEIPSKMLCPFSHITANDHGDTISPL